MIEVQSVGRQHGHFVKQNCQTTSIDHGSSSLCTSYMNVLCTWTTHNILKKIITFTTAFIARRLHLLHHSRTNRTNGHLDATPFTPWASPNSSSFSTSPAKNMLMFVLFFTGPSRKLNPSQENVMYCNKTCYEQTDFLVL